LYNIVIKKQQLPSVDVRSKYMIRRRTSTYGVWTGP